MAKQKVFISSVQTEFAVERQALYNYIISDPLLGRFFEPFIFEQLPAIDQEVNDLYLKKVERCHIYIALLGLTYGSEDQSGVSPTEREFNKATELNRTRLVFLTNHLSNDREQKQNSFIKKAQSVLVRRKFSNLFELKAAVYASLINYLMEKEIIRTGPYDATFHTKATIEDIDENKVEDFVRVAGTKRGFPLKETASIFDVFEHLNLINKGKLTYAALLLFGKDPQKFFINSEVRCAHFHGNIIEKPILSYKVFKGDIFELVDQVEDFVLSKLDYSVGTRSVNTSIPSKYEIPKEIVSEAIVNALAHRDYTHNGSVQVMLFRDRLEISNPGALPLGWSIDKLKRPHSSVPFNPLLAESMYFKGYIERIGTGTADIVRIAKESDLQEPDFVQEDDFKIVIYRPSTDQVPTKYRPSTDQVDENLTVTVEIIEVLKVMSKEMSRKEIQKALKLKHAGNFRENYLDPTLAIQFIKMKYADSPNHPKQKYLITEKGKAFLKDK